MKDYTFLGVNLNALLDLARTPLNTNTDPLESGKSYELIGEYVDMSDKYDKILEDKVGLRLGPDRVVKPEDVFYQDSSFQNYLRKVVIILVSVKNILVPKL